MFSVARACCFGLRLSCGGPSLIVLFRWNELIIWNSFRSLFCVCNIEKNHHVCYLVVSGQIPRDTIICFILPFFYLFYLLFNLCFIVLYIYFFNCFNMSTSAFFTLEIHSRCYIFFYYYFSYNFSVRLLDISHKSAHKKRRFSMFLKSIALFGHGRNQGPRLRGVQGLTDESPITPDSHHSCKVWSALRICLQPA